MDHEVLMA
jgi:hypothetical protein